MPSPFCVEQVFPGQLCDKPNMVRPGLRHVSHNIYIFFVSVLLSPHFERFSFSPMWDFFNSIILISFSIPVFLQKLLRCKAVNLKLVGVAFWWRFIGEGLLLMRLPLFYQLDLSVVLVLLPLFT